MTPTLQTIYLVTGLFLLPSLGALVFLTLTLCVAPFRRRRLDARPPSVRQYAHEVVTMIFSRLLDALFLYGLISVFKLKVVMSAPLGRSVCVALSMLVWFEIWFYGTHRLLHTRVLFPVHRRHHLYRIVTPLTAFSMSWAERFLVIDIGLMAPLIFVAQFMPVPLYAYFLFTYTVALFDVLGHCNIEFFPGKAMPWPLSYVTSSSSHFLHHAKPAGNYGFCLHVLDRFFGSHLPPRPTPVIAVEKPCTPTEGATSIA